MKTLKKLSCLLLALVMVLSLGVTAFAAEGGPDPATPEKGSVSINGALKGNTFTLYKIFDLESYNPDTGTYAYTIKNDSPLYATIHDMTLKVGDPLEDKNVFALTSKDENTDYVQLTVTFQTIQNDSTEIKAIASLLMEKIATLNETQKAQLSMRQVQYLGVSGETEPSKNETKLPAANVGDITTSQVAGEGNEDKYNIKFSNLDLGYYLVDSSAGTMIGLTTTNPDAEIKAKNELPNVVKEVKKNSDGTWDKQNTKAVGETVNYRVHVAVKSGATNYVIYDSLSEGLTFDKITKVYYGYANNPDNAYVIYDASTGTAITDPSLDDYFTYATMAEGGETITHKGKDCCFSMKFTDTFLEQVLNGSGTNYQKTIFVEYDAKLNENAVIAGDGNPNDVYLTYGKNDVDVAEDQVKTYTYQMELVKTTTDNTVLQGAEFEVYTHRELIQAAATALDQTEELSGKLSFVKTNETIEGKQKTVYTVATAEQIAGTSDPQVTTVTTIEAGDVIIRGLGGNFPTTSSSDGRPYYFKETKAPDGYTLLPSSTEFNIYTADNMATFEVSGAYKNGGLEIENKSGSLLPTTGGIGTTIFYVVGGILVLAAVVLLVTKKRMNAAK